MIVEVARNLCRASYRRRKVYDMLIVEYDFRVIGMLACGGVMLCNGYSLRIDI